MSVEITVLQTNTAVTVQPIKAAQVSPVAPAATVVNPVLPPVVVSPIVEIDQVVETAGAQGPAGKPGADGNANRIEYPFTQADVSVAGILAVFHNRDGYPSGVTVVNGDGQEIEPDAVIYASPNAFAINLESFIPLAGNCRVLFSL